MKIRLLIATPDAVSRNLLHSLLNAAMQMVPLDIDANDVSDLARLQQRATACLNDLVLLDWELAGTDTPDRLRELTTNNPRIRVITLLPLHLRQYRQCIWESGACSSIPKEHIDQEWLSTVLCIVHRAMEREERLRASQLTPISTLNKGGTEGI